MAIAETNSIYMQKAVQYATCLPATHAAPTPRVTYLTRGSPSTLLLYLYSTRAKKVSSYSDSIACSSKYKSAHNAAVLVGATTNALQLNQC